MDSEVLEWARAWCERYDNTEEHSAEFNTDMKDEARTIFERIIKDELTR